MIEHNSKICVACGVELRVKKNGVCAVAMAVCGPEAVYQADLWHCPKCGYEALMGFARAPMAIGSAEACTLQMDAAEARGERVIPFWLNDRERSVYEAKSLERQA